MTDITASRSHRHSLTALGRPEWVFAVLALLVLVPLALLTPAGANYDEPMHVLRVDQICHGHILPVFVGYQEGYPTTTEQEKADAALYGGTNDAYLALVIIDTNTAVQLEDRRYTFPTWNDPVSMSDLTYGVHTNLYYYTNTAINSPIVYLPYYPGLLLGEALRLPVYWIVVLMRLGAVLFYTVSLWFCIAHIPFGRWALAAIALLPNQLATVSGVTADTVTNVLCIAFVTTVLTFVATRQTPSKAHWVCLGITTALLPLAKVVYSPFLALLLLVPLCNPELRTRKDIGLMAAMVVCGLALFFAWSTVIKGINPGAMWKANVSPARQLANILSNPMRFIKSFVMSMPFPDVFQLESYGLYGGLGNSVAPFYMIGGGWPIYLMLVLSLASADPRDRMPQGMVSRRGTAIIVLLAVACACVGLIFVSIYLTYSAVGDLGFDGIQARYFIPVALLLQLVLLTLFAGLEAPEMGAGEIMAGDPQLLALDAARKERARLIKAAFIVAALLVEFALLVHVRFALFW